MPNVQFLNNPNIGSVLGQFGSGLLNEVTQNLEKEKQNKDLTDMINNARARINEGASEEDVLLEIFGSGNVPVEERKSAANIISQSRRNQENLKLRKSQEMQKQKQYEEQKILKERELKFKEEAAKNKPLPKSEYEKTKEREMAKSEAEINKEMPKINSALRDAEQMSYLIKQTSGTGRLNLAKTAELSVGAAALIEPMIKIYNPTGVVSAIKLKWINDRFGITNYDLPVTQRGKLKGIENLLKEQKKRLEERQKLIADWNGNPPHEEIRKFDDDSEEIYDAIIGWNKEMKERNLGKSAPQQIQQLLQKAPKDKIITGPNGDRYKWIEDQWMQI